MNIKMFWRNYILTDKEINDNLIKQGYSYDVIQKVFDYLDDLYEN